MKHFNLVAILFLWTTGLASAQHNKLYEISDKKIWIEFTNKWVLDDLVSAKRDAKVMNIMLSYQLIEINGDGFLRKIEATIEYPDGKSTSVTSRVLQEGDVPGLRRDLIKDPF